MLSVVCPKPIKPGDTIAIVAPSEPVSKEDVAKSKEYLESLGYQVKLGKHLFYRIGDYTAGTAEDRADDFNRAFSDPEVSAVFMAEGGYSADQILDLVDYDSVKKNPKIFVGYSDGTIIQLALLAKTGLVTFHGDGTVDLFDQPEYTKENLWNVLTGKGKAEFTKHNEWEVLRHGKGSGMLIGGNLDTLCSVLGTDYSPFSLIEDKKIILFWEEIGDQYNSIIRNLFQLRNAGIFEKCNGMVVGNLTNVSETEYVGVPELKSVLSQMARSFDFPILWNVDFAHEEHSLTIPLGMEGEIETKSKSFKFVNCLA